MANEKFKVKKGVKANLPAKEAGSLVFATDTQEMFLDVSFSERIRMGQGKDSSGDIKLFSEGSDSNTFTSDISNQELVDGDLVLIKFDHDKVVMPNAVFGTLNNKTYKVTQLFGANAYTYILFKVVSAATTNTNGILLSIGQINQPITTSLIDNPVEITYSPNSTTTTIAHKQILDTDTDPDVYYGDLVTGTDLKKTLTITKIYVDKYGHVVHLNDNISLNANFREDTLTDQTSAQYRNIVVVPSTTDLSTLDVPVGTIIFVKN